jgi:uncharacterized protein (TIGR03435 family)
VTSLAGSPAGVVLRMGRGSILTMAADRIEAKKMPMARLAEALDFFMDRPVLDRTGLQEAFDFVLPLATEDTAVMRVRSGSKIGLDFKPEVLRMADESIVPSLHQALGKVGLRLESTKADVPVLLVDSAHAPSEN